MKKYILENNRVRVALLVIMQTFYTLGTVGVALLLNYLIDAVSDSIAINDIKPLGECVLFCCLYAVVFGGIVVAADRLKASAIRHVMQNIRSSIAGGILHESMAEFSKGNSAEYTALLNQNLDTFEQDYLNNLLSIYDSIVSIAGSALVLILINPVVALISIAAMAIPSLLPGFFNKRLSKRQGRIMESTAAYNAKVSDMLQGFEVIHSFGIADVIRQQQDKAALELEESKEKLGFAMADLYGITNTASIMVQFLIMALSGVFAVRGLISIGSIVAVTQLSGQVIAPAFEMSAKFGQLKAVKPICELIQKISGTKAAPDKAKKELQSELELKNVTYSYPNTANPALKDINIKFERGKKYAVTGKSGSGKSTLLKLLSGSLRGYSGEILSDGVGDVLCDMSVISQNVFMFDDTIRNNITLYGDFTEESVEDAVCRAGLSDVLAKLEDGLETGVEENGKRFSGGERQKIAIARALLHRKNLLLLDEATSALDHENAILVEKEIFGLEDITCIAVTHRLHPETQGMYDEILVMEDGVCYAKRQTIAKQQF